ncbi:MAG: SUMF1/EgtB/PvdO family nonheme iron enzyme [Verrucomicrobiales bacterium]|nr:SUMF1/EgtB/PvdO family nonheme iron enzyme [Verrucomicrobiales bacterium]
MAYDPDPDEFTNFLRKVLDIQLAEPGDQLTEETLEKMARKAGLSEAGWKRVCEKLEEHLQKGRNFLSFENYDEAIVELEQAVALAPYRSGVLRDCGKAHLGLWKESGNKTSRVRAEELLRKSLEIDPASAESAELLTELKKSKPASRVPGKKIALASAVLALVCGGAVWFGSEKTSAVADPAEGVIATAIESVSKPAAAQEFYQSHNIFAKDFKVEFKNSLEMSFVPVPVFEGTREVGSLLFSVHETRIKDFLPFSREVSGIRWKSPDDSSLDNHPVSGVDWHEAKAYCEWLTLKEREAGLIGPGDRYRLPTDHEWSCAIGIGQLENANAPPKSKHNALRDVYPWGIDWPPATVLGNYSGPENDDRRAAPFLPDAYSKAAPVGSFPLSHWGIKDLGGNLWEWTESHWDADMLDEKAVRGGSYVTNNGNHILSAGRRWIKSYDRLDILGFRVVLDRESGADED